jgi:Rieske Fe-S protein
MNETGRRSFLKWISSLLAAGVAAIVGVPTVSFAIGSLRRRGSSEATLRKVARLGDLPQDRPVMIPIIGDLEDAWTVYPNEPIGRVWVSRGAVDSANPANTPLKAFSAVCPHLGCTVQMAGDGQQFVCPCHNAVFKFDGERVAASSGGSPNPSPRGMDPLPCKIVQDEATKDWWVEVKYEQFELGRPTSIPTA